MATASIGAESVPTNTNPFDPADWLIEYLDLGGSVTISLDGLSLSNCIDRRAADITAHHRDLQDVGNRKRLRTHILAALTGGLR